MNKISGIYQIQSKIHPERLYIGSTVNIYNRHNNHFKDLRKGVHGNSKLQNHFNKHGETDLQFSLLLECDKEVLINAEQAFIDYYKPWFNICRVAGSMLGYKHTKKTLKNMSNSHIGQIPWNKDKKATPEAIQHLRESHLGFKQPQELNKQRSIKLMGRPSPMKNRHHTEESKKKQSERLKGINTWSKGIILSKETIDKMTEKRKKPILQYDEYMHFIKEWPSALDASKELLICKSSFHYCLHGKHKTAGGFIWKYKNVM